MRANKGCQSCRIRHVKCVTKPGQSICNRCQESKRKCVFDPLWRFKQVSHVDTASQGIRSRTELRYSQDQPWVPLRKVVAFIPVDGKGSGDETTGILEERPIQVVSDSNRPDDASTVGENPESQAPCAQDSFVEEVDSGISQFQSSHNPGQLVRTIPSEQDNLYKQNGQGTWTDGFRVPTGPSPSAVEYQPSPSFSVFSQYNGSNRYLDPPTGGSHNFGTASFSSSPASALTSPAGPFAPVLSHRETLLIQYFIQRLSPWVRLFIPNALHTKY